MATEPLVPRANNEGSIGTPTKHWGAGYFQTLSINGQNVTVQAVSVANQNARFALTSSSVKVGDIVQQGTSAPYQYFSVVDVNNLANASGYSAAGGSVGTIANTVAAGDDFRITNSLSKVATMADLLTLAIPTSTVSGRVELGGYYALNDKAPVSYQWVPASTATHNGGSVINPTGHSGNGRWIQLWNGTTINVADWGAKGDNTFDNTAIFQAAADYIANTTAYGTLYIPVGTYKYNGLRLGTAVDNNTQYQTAFISIIGENKFGSILKYMGPTTGTGTSTVAIYFARNVFSNFEKFSLINGTNIVGTTYGIQMGGVSFGNSSQGNVFRHLYINGFYVGWKASMNPIGSVNGDPVSCSEISFKNCLICNNYYGMYIDDFNALNISVDSCDFEFNNVGAYSALGGVVFTGCSGEFNRFDFWFAAATNNNSALKVDGYRSEHAGMFLYSRASTTLINVNIAGLQPWDYPVDSYIFPESTFTPHGKIYPPTLNELGISVFSNVPPAPRGVYQPLETILAGTTSSNPSAPEEAPSIQVSQTPILITSSGDGKGQYSFENCRITGQIVANGVDVQLKNTQVGVMGDPSVSDPIFFINGGPNSAISRYEFEGCVVSDIGMNDVFYRYPNKRGVFSNGVYNDSVRHSSVSDTGTILSALQPMNLDLSKIQYGSTNLSPGSAYIDTDGSVKMVLSPLQILISTAKINAADFCLIPDPSLYSNKNSVVRVHDPIAGWDWFSSPDADAATGLTLFTDNSGPNGRPYIRADGVKGMLHSTDPEANYGFYTIAYYIAIFRSPVSTFNASSSIIDKTLDDGVAYRALFNVGTTQFHPDANVGPITASKNGTALTKTGGNGFDLGVITNWMVLGVQTNAPTTGLTFCVFAQKGDTGPNSGYSPRLNADLAGLIVWKTLPTPTQISNVLHAAGVYSGITITP